MLNAALCGEYGYFIVLPFFRKCVEKWKQMKDKEYNYVRSAAFDCAEVCVLIFTNTKASCFLKQHSLFTESEARLPFKIPRIENKGSEIITKTPDGVSCCSMLTRIRIEVLPNSGEPDDTY